MNIQKRATAWVYALCKTTINLFAFAYGTNSNFLKYLIQFGLYVYGQWQCNKWMYFRVSLRGKLPMSFLNALNATLAVVYKCICQTAVYREDMLQQMCCLAAKSIYMFPMFKAIDCLSFSVFICYSGCQQCNCNFMTLIK